MDLSGILNCSTFSVVPSIINPNEKRGAPLCNVTFHYSLTEPLIVAFTHSFQTLLTGNNNLVQAAKPSSSAATVAIRYRCFNNIFSLSSMLWSDKLERL
jgi:hypothetical protein